MPHRKQKKSDRSGQKSIQKPSSSKTDGLSAEAITNGISKLNSVENSAQSRVPVPQFGIIKLDKIASLHGQISGPKSHGTTSTAKADATNTAAQTAVSSNLFKNNLLEKFTVDKSTYAIAKINAVFYPKFENEKSDQEVRIKIIDKVSEGKATLEVSLKHSGSLFMYAGGAYAKNSFGNIYTAV